MIFPFRSKAAPLVKAESKSLTSAVSSPRTQTIECVGNSFTDAEGGKSPWKSHGGHGCFGNEFVGMLLSAIVIYAVLVRYIYLEVGHDILTSTVLAPKSC
jgi:hypothetical protein